MRIVSKKTLCDGRWLTMRQLECEGHDGQPFTWEYFERHGTADVVVVAAFLRHSRKVILIRQFRPAVNNWVIGMPAGICDHGSVEQTALAELREEAGYSGTVRAVSPPMLSNAAVLTDRVYLVTVDVDEEAPANREPLQHLESSEQIEVCLVDQGAVGVFLEQRRAAGDDIGSGVWYLFAFKPAL